MSNRCTWPVLTIFLIYAAFGCVSARAETFCAVTLELLNDHAAPVAGVWIELLDPSGKVVWKERAETPTVQICDFGSGPYTIRVGPNECFPVDIPNVRVVVGTPLSLKVILNTCWYGHRFRSGCLVYFRVTDENGRPIANASFSPDLMVRPPPPKIDEYGRYQGPFLGIHDLTFTAPGFEPAKVHIECKSNEEVDQLVVMRHAP